MAEKVEKLRHYLFCLRHFNDIDNIAPAIHFLLERRPVRVTVLIYSLDYDYRADPSLSFLQKTWGSRLQIYWIGHLAGYIYTLTKRPYLRKFHYRIRKLIRLPVLELIIARAEYAGIMRAWLKPMFEEWGQPSGVIFDQNRTSVIAGLLQALRALGIKRIVSLPVSPWININVMRQVNLIRIDAENFRKLHDYSGFDAIAQTDRYYRDRLDEFFNLFDQKNPFQGREQILGAIRYTDEWLRVRQRYVEHSNAACAPLKAQSGRRRILIIPSHRKNNSFWEEYLRTLHFLSQFEEYDIVVKPHTRYDDGYDDLPKNIRLLPGQDTSTLINWSEIILFWSSSVVLEGFQKGRIMINLDYLNGNQSVFSLLRAGYECRCRDDLLKVLRSKNAMERAEVASAEGREVVRQNVIEGGQGQGVVERYLEFCEG